MDFYTDYASGTILGNDENFQLLKGSAADREMKTKTNKNINVNNETNKWDILVERVNEGHKHCEMFSKEKIWKKKLGEKRNDWVAGLSPKNPS